jgi:hypothetical protein
MSETPMPQEQNEQQLPSVLQSPYKQMEDAMKDEKYTEAFLLLESLYEAALKLIVLSAFAVLRKKGCPLVKKVDNGEKATPYLSALMKLLGAPPPFGIWASVCEDLKKIWDDEEHGTVLEALLPEVKNLINNRSYEGKNIIEWRNAFFHGTAHDFLSEESQEQCCELTTDLKQKLGKFLEKNRDLLLQLEVISTESGHTVLDAEIEEYLHYKDDATFFFNRLNVRQTRDTWDGLCYSNGGRHKFDSEKLLDIYKNNIHLADSIENLEQDAIDKAVSDGINALHDAAEFVRPEHFIGWLDESLKKIPKGVLFLAAGRGLGKSVFCRALYPLHEDKKAKEKKNVFYPDVAVRCFYASRAQFSHNVADFLHSIEECMETNNEGTEKHPMTYKHDLPLEPDQYVRSQDENDTALRPFRKRKMAEFLNAYRKHYEKYKYGKKLVLVIDGLDELLVRHDTPGTEPHLTSDRIFDYIPDTDMLDDGVYILVTSRPESELETVPEAMRGELSALYDRADKKREFLPTDMENIDFLRAFLKEYKPANVEQLIEQANHRILELHLLTFCFKKEEINQMKGNIDVEKLIGRFFEKLNVELPKSLAEQCHRMLLAIANAGEPITLDELIYLIDEPHLSYRLLWLLKNINAFLKYERNTTRKSSLISIANEAYGDVFRNDEKSMELQKQWINMAKGIDLKQIPVKDGELLVLASFWDNFRKTDYFPEDGPKEMLELTNDLVDDRSFIYRRRRAARAMVGVCQFLKLMLPWDQDASIRRILAGRLLALGRYLYSALNELSDATAALEEGMNEFLSLFEICPDIKDIEKIVFVKGHMLLDYLHHRREKNSDVSSRETRSLIDNLPQEALQTLDKRTLANLHSDFAAELCEKGEHVEAIEERSKIIQVFEELLREESLRESEMLTYECDLGSQYAKRARIYRDLEHFDRALRDCDKAIDILKKIDEDPLKKADENDRYRAKEGLAHAYSTRSVVHFCGGQKKNAEALADAGNAIKILEDLNNEGRLAHFRVLIGTYQTRSVLLCELKRFTESLADINSAIDILEKLQAEGKLYDIDIDVFEVCRLTKKIVLLTMEKQNAKNRKEAHRQAGRDRVAGGSLSPPAQEVPRNAPCFCGSGKKYKVCCGKK